MGQTVGLAKHWKNGERQGSSQWNLRRTIPMLHQLRLPLALGGWAFFIAENAILSENRGFLMEQLGEEGYYYLYGTCSTAASVGILYGYRRLRQGANQIQPHGINGFRMLAAGSVMSVGLILASQVAPKMQIPVSISDQGRLVVRCPFDFSKKISEEGAISGLERVSRHSSLWALGLTTAGNAALQPTLPLALWMLGPTAVAVFGGAHTDSRFRRGIGGHLDPLHEAQTSHFPFVSLMQQGKVLQWIQEDLKPLNAALAVSSACLWVYLTRGRYRSSATIAKNLHGAK